MIKKKCESARRKAVQERSRDLVDAILTAAIRILDTKSLTQTTTTEIAEKAGVGIGSVYEYFPDKQAIYISAVEKLIEEGTASLISDLEANEQKLRNLQDIVQHLASAYFDRYSEHEVLIRSFREVVLDIRSVPDMIERSDAAIAMQIEKMLRKIGGQEVTTAGVTAGLTVRSIHATIRVLFISVLSKPDKTEE